MRTSATAFTVSSRDVAAESVPEGGGTETFDTPEAAAINRARLAHLASLALPLDGRRVLDVGAGVGHLAQFFVERGCEVVATDAREENVLAMRERYPHLDARVVDVEEDVSGLGRFDVVFCYGLLYHLENPIRALRSLAGVCDDLLLIETMICDSRSPVLRLDDETLTVSQALRGIAHRPSPSYVAMALNRIGMPHVYQAVSPPAHPDYDVARLDDLAVARDGHLLRGVFVAARRPVESPALVSMLDAA